MNLTRILLVDDHDLLRRMLAEHLEKEGVFEVVGSAADADEAVTLAERCHPDLIVMDIDMPGADCFEAARTILASWPATRIVFLSAFVHDRYIEDALRVGAMGYLTKTESPQKVVAALREVAAGRAAYSDEVRSRMVVGSSGMSLVQPSRSRAATLSRREIEVLRYVARGMATKEIAQIMHVSAKTIDNHRSNLMDKLDIHDRVELARFAIREGLAEL